MTPRDRNHPRASRLLRLQVAAALATACGAASADTMGDWSAQINAAAAAAGIPIDQNGDGVNDSTVAGPPVRHRLAAMSYIAVHDALNSIAPRYRTHSDLPRAAATASADAAIAEAAYQVLRAEFPASVDDAAQDPALALYHRTVGNPACDTAGSACAAGRDAGARAARAILAERAGDGSRARVPDYNLPNLPGIFRPMPSRTPGDATTPNSRPSFQQWGQVKPFGIDNVAQFLGGGAGAFDVAIDEYARDYAEVKRVGALNAAPADRSPEQTATVAFWAVHAPSWTIIARSIAVEKGLDAWDHARLMALVSMSLSSADVKVFYTKYVYALWRPITAIRATEDPTWNSVLVSPPYPDYTSGASIGAGAATEILRRHFRTDDIGFTLTATTSPAGHPHLPPPPITRTFTSLSQAAESVASSRVFAGIHFRAACTLGLVQGQQTARQVFENNLEPLR